MWNKDDRISFSYGSFLDSSKSKKMDLSGTAYWNKDNNVITCKLNVQLGPIFFSMSVLDTLRFSDVIRSEQQSANFNGTNFTWQIVKSEITVNWIMADGSRAVGNFVFSSQSDFMSFIGAIASFSQFISGITSSVILTNILTDFNNETQKLTSKLCANKQMADQSFNVVGMPMEQQAAVVLENKPVAPSIPSILLSPSPSKDAVTKSQVESVVQNEADLGIDSIINSGIPTDIDTLSKTIVQRQVKDVLFGYSDIDQLFSSLENLIFQTDIPRILEVAPYNFIHRANHEVLFYAIQYGRILVRKSLENINGNSNKDNQNNGTITISKHPLILGDLHKQIAESKSNPFITEEVGTMFLSFIHALMKKPDNGKLMLVFKSLIAPYYLYILRFGSDILESSLKQIYEQNFYVCTDIKWNDMWTKISQIKQMIDPILDITNPAVKDVFEKNLGIKLMSFNLQDTLVNNVKAFEKDYLPSLFAPAPTNGQLVIDDKIWKWLNVPEKLIDQYKQILSFMNTNKVFYGDAVKKLKVNRDSLALFSQNMLLFLYLSTEHDLNRWLSDYNYLINVCSSRAEVSYLTTLSAISAFAG